MLTFLKLALPSFLKADENLEVDYWIRTIEQKFGLIYCSDVQKTQFAPQQLQSPASVWWANFLSTQPEGHQVPWSNFGTAFQAHHIPGSVIELKLEQFLKLQQGDQSVLEYLCQFNHLSQYAPKYVSTDAEKNRWFVRGLHTELQAMLTTVDSH